MIWVCKLVLLRKGPSLLPAYLDTFVLHTCEISSLPLEMVRQQRSEWLPVGSELGLLSCVGSSSADVLQEERVRLDRKNPPLES